jgi:hypothetical protein
MPFQSIDTSPERAVHADGCRNCGAALVGPYCAQCGQQDVPLDPTLRALAAEGVEQAFDVDGRLWRSLRVLFTRPGVLTNDLFAGRRAAYVSPFRLYLIFGAVVFAATAFAGSRAMVTPQGNTIDLGMGMTVTFDPARPGDREKMIAYAQRIVTARTEWQPRVMLLAVPILALAVMGMTWRTKRHYPQHVQFTLHALAVVFAGLAVVWVLPPLPRGSVSTVWRTAWGLAAVHQVVQLALYAYVVMAFRRVYGGGWLVNILRVLVLAALFFLMWNLVTVALFVLRIGNG